MARSASLSVICLGAFALATLGCLAPFGSNSLAQQNKPAAKAAAPAGASDPVLKRIDRLEEELVDLKVVIGTLQSLLKGGAGATASGTAPGAGGADPTAQPQPQAGGATDLATRLDVMETQIRALTGQIAQLTTQLAAVQDRLAEGAQPGVQPGAAPATGQPQQPAGTTPAPAAGTRPPAFGSTTVTPAPMPPMPPAPALPSPSAAVQPRPPAASTVVKRPLPPAAPAGRRVAAVSDPAAQTAYAQALGHLQRGDFRAAEGGFRQFLKSYPKDARAGDAQYWLGETYFITGQYRKAATAFLQGYRDYRGGSKGPDSLLRLGMSLYQIGEKDAACQTLAEVRSKFPSAPDNLKKRAVSEMGRAGCK